MPKQSPNIFESYVKLVPEADKLLVKDAAVGRNEKGTQMMVTEESMPQIQQRASPNRADKPTKPK